MFSFVCFFVCSQSKPALAAAAPAASRLFCKVQHFLHLYEIGQTKYSAHASTTILCMIVKTLTPLTDARILHVVGKMFELQSNIHGFVATARIFGSAALPSHSVRRLPSPLPACGTTGQQARDVERRRVHWNVLIPVSRHRHLLSNCSTGCQPVMPRGPRKVCRCVSNGCGKLEEGNRLSATQEREHRKADEAAIEGQIAHAHARTHTCSLLRPCGKSLQMYRRLT